ncbi:hypothetical protein EV2_012723 [Malus domestica]
MMRQYPNRCTRGMEWPTRLTEGARMKLNTNVQECRNITVAHAGEDEFEVHDISQKHIVQLPTSHCSCME